MANTKVEILELRFDTRDPLATGVYVLYGPPSDGILGVQGWHGKLFIGDPPPPVDALIALMWNPVADPIPLEPDSPLLWPQMAPP